METEWITMNVRTPAPPTAIIGGYDSDGTKIYVGRTYCCGDVVPVNVMPDDEIAFFSYNKKEYMVNNVEVLIGNADDYAWQVAKDGEVPPHAKRVGRTVYGEPLYVGRFEINGCLTVGKVQATLGRIYIPYHGKEYNSADYEILVQTPNWLKFSASEANNLPANAIHVGNDVDGDAIYLGRASHMGVLLPAKVMPKKMCAHIAFYGAVVEKQNFEILVGDNYVWLPASNGVVPTGAISCGYHSVTFEPFYIGRGLYAGSLTPGRVQASRRCIFIPSDDREIELQHYEVLVRQ